MCIKREDLKGEPQKTEDLAAVRREYHIKEEEEQILGVLDNKPSSDARGRGVHVILCVQKKSSESEGKY